MIVKSNSKLDYILNNYSQIDIFALIFDTTVEDIEYCLEHTSNKINNPLRDDVNPSLGFMYRNDGRLIAKDWGNNSYTGDIFDVLATVNGLDVKNDFIKLCDYIINHKEFVKPNTNITKRINAKNFKEFRYTIRQYEDRDIEYWNNAGISTDLLKYRNVYAIEYLWIENMRTPYYAYTKNNPLYLYSLGYDNLNREIVKAYAPTAKKLEKFRTNNTLVFEAIHELYDADILIITKSRKDKLVLESILLNYLNGIFFDTGSHVKYCITSFNSETYFLKPKLVEYLKSKYKNIILNVDYDKTGIMNAFYHKILYNFDIVFLGNNNNLYKEFSDKDIKRLFSKIVKINMVATLSNIQLKKFILEHKSNFKDKDVFDYVSNNDTVKASNKIKKLFKI